jgi:hypothetical protein
VLGRPQPVLILHQINQYLIRQVGQMDDLAVLTKAALPDVKQKIAEQKNFLFSHSSLLLNSELKGI